MRCECWDAACGGHRRLATSEHGVTKTPVLQCEAQGEVFMFRHDMVDEYVGKFCTPCAVDAISMGFFNMGDEEVFTGVSA